MKSSKDLFYGIIIGILLVACTGSFKEDKAEFKTESVFTTKYLEELNLKIKQLKKMEYTIIDVESVGELGYLLHIGK
jgi:hypothetical protein